MAYNQSYSQGSNDKVRFDLMEHIGVLAKKDNGWTKEVNIVAWNGGKAKVDIREWDPEHTRMTKGITLFEEEAETLVKTLARRYGLRYINNAPRPEAAQSHTESHTAAAEEPVATAPAETQAAFDEQAEELPFDEAAEETAAEQS